MTRWLSYSLALLLLSLALVTACDDDSGPGPTDEAGVKQDAKPGDGPVTVGDSKTLPWPDAEQVQDAKVWTCSPGQSNMCDGYKNQYCKEGKCTACPANYVDCDRQGDCECFGACDGTKCVTGGGKK